MPSSRVTRERRSKRISEKRTGRANREDIETARTIDNEGQVSSNNAEEDVGIGNTGQNAIAELTKAFLDFKKTVADKLKLSSEDNETNLQTRPIYSVAGSSGNSEGTTMVPWTFQNAPIRQRTPIGFVNTSDYQPQDVQHINSIMSSRSDNAVGQTRTEFASSTNHGLTMINNVPNRSSEQSIILPAQMSAKNLQMTNTINSTDSNVHGKLNYIHQNLPLSAQVPENVKQEIWAGGYVDLKSLKHEERDLSLVLTGSDKIGRKLGLKADHSNKTLNIDQWVSVFLVYSAVYLQKHPLESEAILGYIETVRGLEKKGGNWRFYDEQFRKLKKTLGLSWNDNHQALWLDARLDQANLSKPSSNDKPYVPIGYCQKFHQGQVCRLPCKYNHRCFKCNFIHPTIMGCAVQKPYATSTSQGQRHATPHTQAFRYEQNQGIANQQVNSAGFNSSFRPNFRNNRFGYANPNRSRDT